MFRKRQYRHFLKQLSGAGLLFLAVTLSSCATFYQKTASIQTHISEGRFEKADQELSKQRKWEQNNHRVLYFMNRGMVLFMLGEHEESNQFFNQADYYIEDYRKKFGTEALALISNPMARPYRPEDFESIMIHYYKALNFIALKEYEGALVECRRVNIRLQQINEQYKEHKNKYVRDAFAHNLMGMIYEATGDYNNAFIAYRNAYEIYENDYTTLFNVTPPRQLKEDLLRTARFMGFSSEVRFFEEKFDMSAVDVDTNSGNLIFIWMNGMGPVKSEWSLNLTNMGAKNGIMLFGSDELGMTFPLVLGNQSQQQQSSFQNLSIIRVAFPKYVERPPLYYQAFLNFNNQSYPLEMAQNINKIAFQSLNDRMAREIGNNLLRLATKQTLERVSNNQNKNLGTIVSIVNAMTERADTRNWQSLPYSLSYTRVPLPEGQHNLTLQQRLPGGGVDEEPVNIQINAGETAFRVFHQMGTR